MITAGRSNSDFKVQKALGNTPYTNQFSIIGKGENDTTNYKLCTTINSMKALPHFLINTATKVKVSSTDANDNSAGTGARFVVVVGLDENYEIQEEIVAMNGQNGTETNLTWIRVFELTIIDYGTNVEPITGDSVSHGIIYCGTGNLTLGVPDNKIVAINPDDNDPNSRVGIFTVPENNLLLIKSISLSATPDMLNNTFAFIQIGIKLFGLGETQWFKTQEFFFDEQFQYIPESLILIPPKSDLQIRFKTNNTKSKTAVTTFEVELRELRA